MCPVTVIQSPMETGRMLKLTDSWLQTDLHARVNLIGCGWMLQTDDEKQRKNKDTLSISEIFMLSVNCLAYNIY